MFACHSSHSHRFGLVVRLDYSKRRRKSRRKVPESPVHPDAHFRMLDKEIGICLSLPD
jgi:hypothetical protein